MRKIGGLLLILIGIGFVCAAVYTGVYVMLICGILAVVEQCRATVMDSEALKWGIAKIVCCEMAGLIALPGYFCIYKGGKLMIKRTNYLEKAAERYNRINKLLSKM